MPLPRNTSGQTSHGSSANTRISATRFAGEINREKLGKIVFSDPAARKRLNAATHLPVFLEVFKSIVWCWLTCKLVVVSVSTCAGLALTAGTAALAAGVSKQECTAVHGNALQHEMLHSDLAVPYCLQGCCSTGNA